LRRPDNMVVAARRISRACALVALGSVVAFSACGGAGAAGGLGGAGGAGSGGAAGGATGTGGASASGGAAGGATGTGGASASGGAAGGATGTGGASASGGAGSGATGTGGASGSCTDDFSCPDLGTCSLMPRGSGCVRLCSFDPLLQLTTADDVAALAALRCEVISGSLYFAGDFATLAGLETIREVNGDIYLYHPNSLADLGGLSGLETVSGSLLLYYYANGHDTLKVIELPNLESAGAIDVIGNAKGDTVHAIRFPALQTIDDMALNANPTLTEIQMPALRTVTDLLTIAQDTALTSLDGFPSLTSVPRVDMSYDDHLAQCAVDAFIARVGAACFGCSNNDASGTCN
jgi:hypothetical protein